MSGSAGVKSSHRDKHMGQHMYFNWIIIIVVIIIEYIYSVLLQYQCDISKREIELIRGQHL